MATNRKHLLRIIQLVLWFYQKKKILINYLIYYDSRVCVCLFHVIKRMKEKNIQHAFPICTSPDGHSHLYVSELHSRSEPQVESEGSHGSHSSLPTERHLLHNL